MDTRTEQAVETTLQSELLYNERIIQHPKFGAVRLTRPTPYQEKLIAEARRKQTHKDMRDPDVLSRDQLEKLAIEKGMWTADMTQRITDLTHKTGEAMGLLDALGFKEFDVVTREFQNALLELLRVFDEDPDTREIISRYYDLTLKPDMKDRSAIMDAAPSTVVDDLLDAADALRTQMDLLNEMFKIRKELNELQAKQVRIFLDSLENRADRAEELATLYYCSADAATGKPLWATYDEIWNARAEDVAFLMDEYHYFRHGITEEFKETLGKYGFIRRLTDTPNSSDDSPDQPQSNSDGESATTTQATSSAPTESQTAPSTAS